MFHRGIGVMADFLKDSFQATDEELKYMDEIFKHRDQKLSSMDYSARNFYGHPSLVIDDFLYHGDLGHATNIRLLREFNIRHIIDICDCPLEKEIEENFNVLWININDELRVDIKKYFDQTNQFLQNCKEKNEKVLVNCQMGISRSSSIVLAYLMK